MTERHTDENPEHWSTRCLTILNSMRRTLIASTTD